MTEPQTDAGRALLRSASDMPDWYVVDQTALAERIVAIEREAADSGYRLGFVEGRDAERIVGVNAWLRSPEAEQRLAEALRRYALEGDELGPEWGPPVSVSLIGDPEELARAVLAVL